ncbi:MAG: Uncharacterised protein [Flavobacteriia bacterium]|nr:MAG: Uncharacterised protein [Flavobacteriia bacterium]
MSALFVECALIGKGKDLIAATVGQDGPVPAHEGMQSSCLLQDVHSGAQKQMVGIAQYDLGLDVVLQFTLMHTLYAAHSSHRHEYGCWYASVIGMDDPGSCPALGVFVLELKPHRPNFHEDTYTLFSTFRRLWKNGSQC